MNTKHIRRYKTEYICIGFALVAAFVGHKDIQRQMNGLSMDRARISESAAQTRQLQESAEAVKQRDAIATQRYKNGCRIVVAVNSPRNLATLTDGEPVLDRISHKPLPAGTVVCDGNGNTAVLIPNQQGKPVVGQMAFTGQQQLAIAQVQKIRGAKVFYNTPEK